MLHQDSIYLKLSESTTEKQRLTYAEHSGGTMHTLFSAQFMNFVNQPTKKIRLLYFVQFKAKICTFVQSVKKKKKTYLFQNKLL